MLPLADGSNSVAGRECGHSDLVSGRGVMQGLSGRLECCQCSLNLHHRPTWWGVAERMALHQTALAVSSVGAVVPSMLVMLGTLQDAGLQKSSRARKVCFNCVKYLVRLRPVWFLMSRSGSAARGLYCMCPSTTAEAWWFWIVRTTRNRSKEDMHDYIVVCIMVCLHLE